MIEDWEIISETKLHGVKCEYVFMRVLTQDNPNPIANPIISNKYPGWGFWRLYQANF
ncbi:pentapeptide repeat-containing protein [Calothrix sp. NIES-2098]|nr:pentapeptide repeat-containing protein [Calothrix sp. NIES-2098]